MFVHKLEDQVSRKTYIDWFILSFLAGSINTGGFLASHRFVSHVTGYATLAGISLEQMDWYGFIMTLIIPIAFMVGVMFSAYLTEKQFAHYRHGQKYAPVMQIVAFLLLVVALGGLFGFFGEFGTNTDLKNDYLLSAILCMACGLQNGAITMSSGATVRTTHLTGLTTDLGLGLVRAEITAKNSEQKQKERRSNKLRMGTVASFTAGAIVGAFAFINFKFAGFLLPASIALYFSYVARTTQSE
ncbi:MAG: DUF1275 domain-containing protein [Pseudobdellovibrio sp.]|nr:DUF1275 domain-containing protein [Pseudobdellovibrio sp.]